MIHSAVNRCKIYQKLHIKRKSIKLYIESVHDIRSQKLLWPIHWSLLLGILQSEMGFYRKKFSSKVLILYTVGNFIENWTKSNQRVGSENGLVTSCSCLKILENSILIPLCSWKCSFCNKSDCMQKNLLTFYIKCIWKKTNLRNLWDLNV